VLVGLVAFALAQGLEHFTRTSGFYALQDLQNVAYDRGMTQAALGYQAAHPQPGPIVVVAVKQNTAKDLRNIPSFVPGVSGTISYSTETQRAFHARLVDRLTELGAKGVVFDMAFDEARPKFDPYFAAAIKRNKKVILAAYRDETVEAGGQAETTSVQPPVADLREAAAGMAIVNVTPDNDKAVRTFRWWFPGIDDRTAEDTFYPTLGVAAAALAGDKDPRTVIQTEVRSSGSFLGKPIRWVEGEQGQRSYASFYGERGFPSGVGSVINYENLVRSGAEKEIVDKLRSQIQGKVVIVGDESVIGQDFHRVPVISSTETQGAANQLPGVELQAHIAQTALNGEYPQRAPGALVAGLVLLLCLAAALLGRLLPTGVFLGVSAVAGAGLWFGSIGYLAGPARTFFEPVTATLGLVSAVILETGYMYVAERRQRQQLRRQLTRHVGPGVAEKLAEDEWPEMSGEGREITMVFTDLQGFTTLSETMTSPEICALLNRYFGVVFPILDEHGGTMDKLMGDGMMAYFGWPQRQLDHAARAIRCAVAIQEALEAWQRQPENAGMPPLRTRVGIHTGQATVGEVGSGQRVEFTVIGDVVNTASRLESMNKEYGTTILISESTRNAAGEIVPMEYRGVATVRGRKEPVPVYSVEVESATGRHRTAMRSASMRMTGAASAPAPAKEQAPD
jgi:adenylate cyclase